MYTVSLNDEKRMMTTQFTAQEIDLNSKNNHEMISAFRKVDSEKAEYTNLCISNLENVFENVGPVDHDVTNLQSQLVTLIGDPGMGKTTATQQLAWMWANGTGLLPKMYKLIFFIPIRRVKHGSLFDVLSHLELLPGQVNHQVLTDNAKDILFIIDGADENDITPDIHHLITGEIFPDSTVLMTARPEAKCFKSISVLPRVKVTLLGTDDETIDRYVKDAIQKTEWQSFEDNYKTKIYDTSLLHIPLYLTLLCAVFKHPIAKCLQFKVPESATELFNVFLQVIIKRWLARKKPEEKQVTWCNTFPLGPDCTLPAETKKCLYFIGKLCFLDLAQVISHYEFTDTQASECLLDMQDIDDCGLFTVSKCWKSFVLKYKQLQEYLAALYLSYEGIKEPLFHELLYSEQNKGQCLATVMRDCKLIKVVEFACGLSAQFLKSLLGVASSQLCVMKGSRGEINIYYEAALFIEQNSGDLSGVGVESLEGFSELKHYLCKSKHKEVDDEEFHFLLPDWKYTDKLSFYQKCLQKLTTLFHAHYAIELLSRFYNIILTPVTREQSDVYQIHIPESSNTRHRTVFQLRIPVASDHVSSEPVISVTKSSSTGQGTVYQIEINVASDPVSSKPTDSVSLDPVTFVPVSPNDVSSDPVTSVTESPTDVSFEPSTSVIESTDDVTSNNESPNAVSSNPVTSVNESSASVSSDPVMSTNQSPDAVSSDSVNNVIESPNDMSSDPVISVTDTPFAVSPNPVTSVNESSASVSSDPMMSANESPDAVSSDSLNNVIEPPDDMSSDPVTSVTDTPFAVSSNPVTSVNESSAFVSSDPAMSANESPHAVSSDSVNNISESPNYVSSEPVNSVSESPNHIPSVSGTSVTESTNSVSSEFITSDIVSTDKANSNSVPSDPEHLNSVTSDDVSTPRSQVKLCLDQLQTELLGPFCIPGVQVVNVHARTPHVDLPTLMGIFPDATSLRVFSHPYIPYTSNVTSDRESRNLLTEAVLCSCLHTCQLPHRHVECLLKQSCLTQLVLHNVNILSAMSDSQINQSLWSNLQTLVLQDILGELPISATTAVCTLLRSSCKTLNQCELILRNADTVCDITDAMKTLTSLKDLRLQIKLSDGADVTGEVLISALPHLESLHELCVRYENVEHSLIEFLEILSTQDNVKECHIHEFDGFDELSPNLKERLGGKKMIFTK